MKKTLFFCLAVLMLLTSAGCRKNPAIDESKSSSSLIESEISSTLASESSLISTPPSNTSISSSSIASKGTSSSKPVSSSSSTSNQPNTSSSVSSTLSSSPSSSSQQQIVLPEARFELSYEYVGTKRVCFVINHFPDSVKDVPNLYLEICLDIANDYWRAQTGTTILNASGKFLFRLALNTPSTGKWTYGPITEAYIDLENDANFK